MRYIVFDGIGRGVREFTATGRSVMPVSEGEHIERVSSERASTHYRSNLGSVTPKTPLLQEFDKLEITANGADTATISALPLATVVIVRKDRREVGRAVVNDYVYEFSTDLPGKYTVEIDAVRHIKKEFYIEALS